MTVTRQLGLVCAVALGLSNAMAHAGPCSTEKTTEMRDAGSGPTVGNTGSTVGANSKPDQHPATSAMNQQSGTSPTSSEDAQKQMQGKPTAAQQAEELRRRVTTADLHGERASTSGTFIA